MKKVLAIMGSERLNGHTRVLLDYILDEFYSRDIVEIVKLKKLNFNGCIDCRGCYQVPHCVINDDMVDLYKKIEECDEIILASPIYFNSVSSIMKKFIDRFQVYWSREYILKLDKLKEKMATIIMVGGAKKYNNQFIASELVYEHALRGINATKVRRIGISNTDGQMLDRDNIGLIEFLEEVYSGGMEEYTYNNEIES